MKKIGIIGGGFTGTMTAVHLVRKSTAPCEIIIINDKETFTKGVAYSAYSDKHLLNVITSKMSAFPDDPEHFLDWVMAQPQFADRDRILIANSFMPRRLYGVYLNEIWEKTLPAAKAKNITITLIDSAVTNLDVHEDSVSLALANGTTLIVDDCIIATGNNVPRNPRIKSPEFYESKNYFQNPWLENSVSGVKDEPVLIVGNGLTMVDTVLALLEKGYKGKLYSVSPNGFNILPHRHNNLRYTRVADEMRDGMSLYEVFKLVHKHVKMVREYGVSAEPIIDSLRPFTQDLWKNFTDREKSVFMSRFRHVWGIARHRIPLHSHDKLQQMRIEGSLDIRSGNLIDITESNNGITVEYFDKKAGAVKTMNVSRIINCTGPDSNIMSMDNSFLKNCMIKGILTQDKLKLGIKADTETFEIIDADGKPQKNLFTLGSNLRGELWESTAVNELRGQAEKLAEKLRAVPVESESVHLS